ncbi:MAG: dTDP-4-dehydrorhamnose 3,5-epimerase [Candidatus Sungbacteria bacterium]|nr:dTDP-4-dehydrorhamnose 3,5-epimerase [Candidatus Sungbacteria bacterium]
MIFQKTACEGAYYITQDPREDERGYFAYIFSREEFLQQGIDFVSVRASQMLNKKKGIIRGLHFQLAPKEEQKLIWCTRGRVFDVVADLRPDSPSFGKWFGAELSPENHSMLYIPRGCAHGFQVLAGDTMVEYLASESYSKELERGVRWDDPSIGIEWPDNNIFVSQKDQMWPLLKLN